MVSESRILLLPILLVLFFNQNLALGGDVGINYGRSGTNLPSPATVVNFLTKGLHYSISLIRIPDANPDVLSAFCNTNLVVTIGVPNEDVPSIALGKYNAITWVNLKLGQFKEGLRIRYITVGDELIPGSLAHLVLPAMRNLHEALYFLGFSHETHVTTVVPINALSKSYPPSSGEFTPEISNTMKEVADFLYLIGSPIMINVYPYFALISEPDHISLDYASFRSTTPVVVDQGLEYYNLFDAMVDAFGAAMVRISGKEDVRMVVAQTGWPTDHKTPYSCIENAKIYNNNLKNHVRGVGRTPRFRGINLEAYILDMFNEDIEHDSRLRSFGTFYPNFTEIYQLWR